MEAYAKLVDKTSGDVAEVDQREYMITDLPCVLGRVRMPNCETPTIVIDTSETLISRQHAEIKWSHEAGWTLTCLSKNGLSVDNVRYKKDDEASLRDGSSIHLGNSKLTLILPDIVADSVVHDTTRKRSHDEMASEVDDGAPQANVNEANRYASNEEQSVPSTAKMSYKEMIDSAFDSYELNLDEDDSVLQTELVDWIASKYYKLQDDSETRKQSLRKGLYSILMKHYERIGSDDTNKRQKRGTIRWRTNQVNNQGPPDSDLPPTST